MSHKGEVGLGVTVEAQFVIGEYEVVILSATESRGLETWLRRGKYHIPAGAAAALAPYVRDKSKFFVAKVDPAKVTFEGGHAVLAYVLPEADPVHKVTILPTGMALGVTMHLPEEDKHTVTKDYLDTQLAILMGGRCAEILVYGDLSTGAANDLVGNTELARKMVREWGMSDKIGPMAWGSQGQVFLGEDLMHTRDYSEHTSQIIDDEVEIILRAQEERALEVLARHRGGLDAVALLVSLHPTLQGGDRRLVLGDQRHLIGDLLLGDRILLGKLLIAREVALRLTY